MMAFFTMAFLRMAFFTMVFLTMAFFTMAFSEYNPELLFWQVIIISVSSSNHDK
jgi:hypothetical protein